MQFKPAQITDLPFIVDVYNATIPGRMVTADTLPVSVESRLEWFRAHHNKYPLWVVAERNGENIGWVSLQKFYGRPAYATTAEISIYLAPAQQGLGWGDKILPYAVKQAKSLGFENLLGFIFSHNTPSIRLFQKHGFEKWGEFPEVAIMDGKRYSLSIFGKKI